MVLFRVLKRDTVYVLADNEADAVSLLPGDTKVIRVMPVKNAPKDVESLVVNKENKVLKVSDCMDKLGLRNPRGS